MELEGRVIEDGTYSGELYDRIGMIGTECYQSDQVIEYSGILKEVDLEYTSASGCKRDGCTCISYDRQCCWIV